ncbi:hypothetical protein F4804DRAFT_349748 [Jackrogersella minutella]|nr:hypothetical protein F4804DRAFT_349748 [Jackrogersella minutella]
MRERRSSGVDIPSPLHIIKKGKSMQVLRTSPRKISNESLDSGPEQPLTVVKSRKSQRRANGKNNQSNINNTVSGQDLKKKSRNVTSNTVSSETSDLITPKPRKFPVYRRSSSLQVGRPVSPTFLTKLRSLSNRKGLYSKPTRHGHGSRVSSDTSDELIFKSSDECIASSPYDQSSYSGYSEQPSFTNQSERYRIGSGRTLVDAHTSDFTPDPYMLVPHVSITPESRTLDDGQSYIWTAIEVSGQLFHPRVGNSTYGSAYPSASQAPFLPAHHCDPDLSRYGYLYDTRIDILPTAEGSIIDLIGDTSIRTISPGTSLLILACVRLGTSKAQKSRVSKGGADNLLEDLELELGNVQAEYIHVRVHYCHSGFPAFGNTLTEDGMTSYQTRLETTATGIIKRHNPTSAWSPRHTPISNPLFIIIASHWGPARANEVMYRIMSNRFNPRVMASRMSNSADGTETLIKTPDRTGNVLPIPQRQASLARLSPEKVQDPARKIWTELRRTSSGNRPAFHVSKANRLPAATTFVDVPHPGPVIRSESTRPGSKVEVQRQRELIRETAVHNRRSIGTDSLKSLVPSAAGSTPEGKENSASGSPSPLGKTEGHLEGRKREGRWSLGGWWN